MVYLTTVRRNGGGELRSYGQFRACNIAGHIATDSTLHCKRGREIICRFLSSYFLDCLGKIVVIFTFS